MGLISFVLKLHYYNEFVLYTVYDYYIDIYLRIFFPAVIINVAFISYLC